MAPLEPQYDTRAETTDIFLPEAREKNQGDGDELNCRTGYTGMVDHHNPISRRHKENEPLHCIHIMRHSGIQSRINYKYESGEKQDFCNK
jgi:hypothetical protein